MLMMIYVRGLRPQTAIITAQFDMIRNCFKQKMIKYIKDMAFICYHNFKDIEAKTVKISDEEKNLLFSTLQGYQELFGGVIINDGRICAPGGEVICDDRPTVASTLTEYENFTKKITTAIDECKLAQENMLKAAELIRPSLPRPEQKKMDEIIGNSMLVDGYNLKILQEIKTKLSEIKLAHT